MLLFLLVTIITIGLACPVHALTRTHTQYRWFSLPTDGWNWPTYILGLDNPGHGPATFTLTLKDLQFSSLGSLTYSVDPQQDQYVNLNMLWPDHFDYAKGDPDIINFIIEVRITEQQVDQSFRALALINICFDTDANPYSYYSHYGSTNILIHVPVHQVGHAYYDGTDVWCYGAYPGIGFGKVPKYK